MISRLQFAFLHLTLALTQLYERQLDIRRHIRYLCEDAADVVDQRPSTGSQLYELNRRWKEK